MKLYTSFRKWGFFIKRGDKGVHYKKVVFRKEVITKKYLSSIQIISQIKYSLISFWGIE
jgi:hypothetical protein